MSDIFISYARSTETQAKQIAEALRGLGYGVWRDDEIPANKAYADVIAERLEKAKAVVVIWSADAAGSEWVRSEAERARADHKLVQISVDGARLPMPFDQTQCADLAGWAGDDSQGWKQVVGAVAGLCGQSSDARGSTASAAPRAKSICVLPFVNMSGDPEQEYFSDGISEDIITDLSKVSALNVASRNTAFGFKGKTIDVLALGRQLGVGHVVEGSVRKAGNRVRITAQLIEASSDTHLWADRWDRDLDDIFALQDEISQAIVAALKVKLLPAEKKAIEKRGTESPEAYDLYLMAREQVINGNVGDPRREEAVIGLCKHASEIDPGYARAWALMGWAQNSLAFNRGRGGDNGIAAVERAESLDPSLGLPHAVKAWVLYEARDLAGSLAELDRALALEPESYEVAGLAGSIYYRERRFEDAARWYAKAAEVAENDCGTPGMLVSVYTALGDAEGAQAAARMTIERAEKVLSTDRTSGRALSLGVLALAALGEAERARQWIHRALLVDPDNLLMRYNFATALSGYFGDVDGALELLGPVLANGADYLISSAATDPDFDPIRGEPRFQTMLADAQARLAKAKPQESA